MQVVHYVGESASRTTSTASTFRNTWAVWSSTVLPTTARVTGSYGPIPAK